MAYSPYNHTSLLARQGRVEGKVWRCFDCACPGNRARQVGASPDQRGGDSPRGLCCPEPRFLLSQESRGHGAKQNSGGTIWAGFDFPTLWGLYGKGQFWRKSGSLPLLSRNGEAPIWGCPI